MSAHDLGSRSDLEALQRSGRGKVVLLVLMLLGALAAAGWLFFGQKQGIGTAEDAAKVLVVRTGRVSGYASVLEGNGFDAAEGDLAYWVDKAQTQVPELEVDGIEAVVQLADQFGYGYVVFETPAEVDFGPLDLGDVPEFEEHTLFAVLSIGDFAFPPVMTVNPAPSPALESMEISLLQALFEQEQLAALRPEDERELGVEQIRMRDRLEDALEELDKLPAAEQLAERVLADAQRVLVDDERGEATLSLVGDPLEDGRAVPLPGGEVLSWSRALRVVTPDAVKADLEQVEDELLLVGAAGGAAEDREPCDELAGGKLASTEAVRIDFAADGSAALVKTLTDGTKLWVYRPGTRCGFEDRGAVPPAGAGFEGPLVPHGSGKVAQAGSVAGAGAIRIASAGVAGEQLLGVLPGVELGGVVWLDADHLAALGTGPSVYLFSVAEPNVVLEMDGTGFEGATRLGELAVLGGSKRDLLVTAGNEPRKLYRMTMPADAAGLFAAPPKLVATADAAKADATEPDADGEAEAEAAAPTGDPASTIVELDPASFQITALTHEGFVTNPVSSPDGKRIAFAILERSLDRPDAADDEEIAMLSLGSAGLRVLTRNALHDGQPRFTADGRHIVFLTGATIPKTRWEIAVPRVVATD